MSATELIIFFSNFLQVNMSDYHVSETVPGCPNETCFYSGLPDIVESVTQLGDDNQWVCSYCSTEFTGPMYRLTWDNPYPTDESQDGEESEEEEEYQPNGSFIQPPPTDVFLRSQNQLPIPLALPVSNSNVAYIPPLAVEVPVAQPIEPMEPIEPDAQPEEPMDLDPFTAPVDQLRVMYPRFFDSVEIIDLTNE